MSDDDTEPSSKFTPAPASEHKAAIQQAEQILEEEKSLPKEQTSAIREQFSLLTTVVVNKLVSDQEASQPDPSLREFSRQLQTEGGPITIKGAIDPQNHSTLHLNYISTYISPKDNSLMHVEGVFKSNDRGEFVINQKVKNYDTGKVSPELHKFSLKDQNIKKEMLEAATLAQEMLDIYLEEN